jgi:hypothetical protein
VSGSTTDLLSPIPLDTLYKVKVGNNISDPYIINYSARGFANLGTSNVPIRLSRTGVPDDSVVVTPFGMVKR